MKKNSIWHIVWIISLYALLITILYLVVIYKVKWEDRDHNKYLYFYDCGDTFCTTDIKVDNYYSNVICNNKLCPIIVNTKNNLVVLRENGKEYIFDYLKGQIINDTYYKYNFTDNDEYYIVADMNDNYGVINANGEVVAPLSYSSIANYKDNLVVYEENGLLGINNVSNEDIKIPCNYNDIVLINDFIFGGKQGDTYQFFSLTTGEKINDNIYNYLYAYNGIILAVKNGQIDLLDYNLKSKTIMKINTYYPYTTEIEKGSLNIKTIGNILSFDVYTSDTEYTTYIYDIKNGKLFN